MNRRRAIATATAVAATVAGGTLAVAANVGLMGFARSEPAALSALRAEDPIELVLEDQTSTTSLPTTTVAAQALPPEVVVQYEDVYVRDPAPAAAAELPVTPPPATPTASAPAAAVTGDPVPAAVVTTVQEDEDEPEVEEYEDEVDDEHEDDEYEYEHEEHDGDEDDD